MGILDVPGVSAAAAGADAQMRADAAEAAAVATAAADTAAGYEVAGAAAAAQAAAAVDATTKADAAEAAAMAAAAADAATKVAKLPTVVLVDDYIPAGVNKATTDTATYWRLAITAAGAGGTIRCNGPYRISSELQLLNFQTVEGDSNFWGAGGGGVTTNFLDFRTLTANGNGEYVGFRLAASNNFRRLLLTGPLTGAGFSDPRPSYGVASVTLPTPASSAPKFDQVQFYKWTHGTHLFGAYYTVFTNCEWRYNAVCNYFDSCYNMKLINPMINCRSADDTTSGIGIQIATVVRGLTVLSGSFEEYSTAILSSTNNSTIVVSGVYFETPKFAGCVALDLPDGGNSNTVTVTGSSVYIKNHTYFVRFTHQVGSTLVAHGNKFIYPQLDPAGPDLIAPPTVPLFYGITLPVNSSADLYGDSIYSCYKGGAQTWGYTDNAFASGAIANYRVSFPYGPTSPDPRAAVDIRGRAQVLPLRVVTAATSLAVTDGQMIVNSAAPTIQKLPAIFGQIPGRTVRIKNIGAGTVTVQAAEAGGIVTIDGGTTITSGGTAEYLLYASNWYLLQTSSVTAATQFDVFTASGTWNKPAGAKTHRVVLLAGGSGGASGRRGAAGTVRCGGGGGGGGGLTVVDFDTADLPGAVSVTVGAAGIGGPAVTTDDTNGNPGGLGTVTGFSTYAAAVPGIAAVGGTNALGTGGGGGIGTIVGSGGGSASTTGGAGGASSFAGGPGGGGSGGGISAANSAANGGTGFGSRSVGVSSAAGGVVDSTVPAGGTISATKGSPGPGGGGGAASITTAAQAGATALGYGGGGGGGGASLNGSPSGAGGNGAPGYCLVITYFA